MINNNIKTKNDSFVVRNNLIDTYLDEIRKDKILTADEERALFAEYEKTKDKKIKDEIIRRNQRFVFAIAKRYAIDDKLMDLIEEGNIGLLIAFDNYDYHTGNRFCSYAVWYIRREINSYLINKDNIIRKSNSVKTATRVNRIRNAYFAENGRYPSEEEIIKILKNKYGIIINNKIDLVDLTVMGLNDAYDDSDNSSFENSSEFNLKTSVNNDYKTEEDNEYSNAIISYLLNSIKSRDRKIIKMAFGIGYLKEYTNEEIANELGLTKERVRQIKNACLDKFKAFIKQSKAIA